MTELDWLEQREEIHRVVEQAVEIGHFRWDLENNRLDTCSEGYARIFGLTVAQALEAHNSWDKVIAEIHPEDRDRYRNIVINGAETQGPDLEYRVQLRNGETRYLREIYVNKADEKGISSNAVGIIQDITSRVRYTQELEQRDKLVRQAEYLTDIGYFVFDEENEKYLYVSKGFAHLHGQEVDEFLESKQSVEDDLSDVVDADRQRVADAYKGFIETGDDLEVEYRLIRSDGEERWFRELNRARTMQDGKVLHALGTTQDVTRQKRIEQELRYKDTLANQAEALTDIGHFVYDRDGECYLYTSPGLASIYGVEPEDLPGKHHSERNAMEFVHADDRQALTAFYSDYDVGGTSRKVEFRLVIADGETRWIRETSKLHVDETVGEDQIIGVMMDITAQKNTEEEILRANENLEQQVIERTRELAGTVERLEQESRERERVTAELQFLANHDALTGLPSLRLGKDRLQQGIALSRRNQKICAVMFLDLDGFKEINDQYGHETGDNVLVITANRIKSTIRDTDTVARIGGDEFLVVVSNLPSTDIVDRIASALVERVAEFIDNGSAQIKVGVSIGIALFPEQGSDIDELIRKADKTMYEVKRRGKNGFGYTSGKPLQ